MQAILSPRDPGARPFALQSLGIPVQSPQRKHLRDPGNHGAETTRPVPGISKRDSPYTLHETHHVEPDWRISIR